MGEGAQLPTSAGVLYSAAGGCSRRGRPGGSNSEMRNVFGSTKPFCNVRIQVAT